MALISLQSLTRLKHLSGAASFKLEIAAALLVKFILLAGLWWLFFTGNKALVDDGAVAGKLFGEASPEIKYLTDRENRE